MLNPHSLGATINAVNEAFLYGRGISKSEAKKISLFIAGRQGLPGSYGGLFAPFEEEIKGGFHLFTSEPLSTKVGLRHILGEEALRILKMLDIQIPEVQKSLARAQENFTRWVAFVQGGRGIGTFCCGKCSVAYWRGLQTRWTADAEERLRLGMAALRNSRQNGQWGRYPFYYTVHCLCELPDDIAKVERDFIRPRCERLQKFLKPQVRHYHQKSAILNNLLKSA